MLTKMGFDRRQALKAVAAAGVSGLAGCCSMRPFATPSIEGAVPALGAPLKPIVRKAPGTPSLSIDVHTHFFNGTDVPVKGYLEGPVAHDLKEPLRSLARAAAGLADALVSIAPTAAEEYSDLVRRFSPTEAASGPVVEQTATDVRTLISQRFFEAARGSEFEKQYNAIKRSQRNESKAVLESFEQQELNALSLLNAVQSKSASRPSQLTESQKALAVQEPYADGVLAFVGHMLSPRWTNLRDYAQGFSSGEGAFGINHALGALVDFDGWLDCPPRSAHDDQVKLHQLLSSLSGGYMKPLVAYNPWTDVGTGGAALRRVEDAVKNRGFAGVKIYPPNGFFPYGNVLRKGAPSIGPSFADLDKALWGLWELCASLNVPVMAHTNHSSGKDNDFDQLGGPEGWRALLKRFAGTKMPLVNLGHFGGDTAETTWTQEFAQLMASPGGERIYGDTGYWSSLTCQKETSKSCTDARARLAEALKVPGVPKRVMYGSDWFMLSKERNWADYPFQLQRSIQAQSVLKADDFFGLNAKACYAEAGLA